MDAKDLRIGNLVLLNGEVHEAKNDLIGFLSYLNIGLFADDGINVEPIKLTEDWLIRFGFKNGCFKNEKEPISVELSHSDLWNVWLIDDDKKLGLMTKIRFVHELQNLYLSLTGEELTIKS